MNSSSMKDMIESILIKEVERLFSRASGPIGLDLEDIRKLEILSKIKDLEKLEDKKRKLNPLNKSLDELKEMAKSKDERQY